jgi:hypothetical protein
MRITPELRRRLSTLQHRIAPYAELIGIQAEDERFVWGRLPADDHFGCIISAVWCPEHQFFDSLETLESFVNSRHPVEPAEPAASLERDEPGNQ